MDDQRWTGRDKLQLTFHAHKKLLDILSVVPRVQLREHMQLHTVEHVSNPCSR